MHFILTLFLSVLICCEYVYSLEFDLSSWELVSENVPLANRRMQGIYDAGLQDNDCIYLTDGNRNYYCFRLSTQQIEKTINNGIATFSGAYKSSALFPASETGDSSDIAYFFHANYRYITKYDITNSITTKSALSMSADINTNPCMVRHPTNTEYLFIAGAYPDHTYSLLIVYDIANEYYFVVNNLLHHVHEYPNCASINVNDKNYLFVIGGKSIYIEKIDLDKVIYSINELKTTMDTLSIAQENGGGIYNVSVNTEWEILNVTLSGDDINNVDYNRAWSSSVAIYGENVFILGGRISFTIDTRNILYFNAGQEIIGFIEQDLPYSMGDALAMYVFCFFYL